VCVQGNTFSAWTLCDLHDLEVCVTLLLFGNEHKEHWKTDVGTVIGVLNPNIMKPRDGYDGVGNGTHTHARCQYLCFCVLKLTSRQTQSMRYTMAPSAGWCRELASTEITVT